MDGLSVRGQLARDSLSKSMHVYLRRGRLSRGESVTLLRMAGRLGRVSLLHCASPHAPYYARNT